VTSTTRALDEAARSSAPVSDLQPGEFTASGLARRILAFVPDQFYVHLGDGPVPFEEPCDASHGGQPRLRR
jgi:hypothetical protein